MGGPRNGTERSEPQAQILTPSPSQKPRPRCRRCGCVTRIIADTPGDELGIAVSGNYVYLAADSSGLVILPAQCDSGVAVYLAAFEFVVEKATVFLRWQVVADGDPVVFRLVGSDGQREWEVPYVADSSTLSYAATDRSIHLRGRSEISYRLLMSRDGLDWSLLKATTAMLPTTPALRTQILSTAPNPFNPRTTIRFECSQAGRVQLSIHDLAGRRVALLVDEWLASGAQERVWNGRDASDKAVASEHYVVRLQVQDKVDMQKIVLLK